MNRSSTLYVNFIPNSNSYYLYLDVKFIRKTSNVFLLTGM